MGQMEHTSPIPEWLRALRQEDWEAPVDLDRTIRSILEGLRRGFRVGGADLFLYDRGRKQLVTRVGEVEPKELRVPL